MIYRIRGICCHVYKQYDGTHVLSVCRLLLVLTKLATNICFPPSPSTQLVDGIQRASITKQPQRSNLDSDFISVAPITYLAMCMFLFGTRARQP